MVDPTGILSKFWSYVCCQREEPGSLAANLENDLKMQIRKVANDSVENGQSQKANNWRVRV